MRMLKSIALFLLLLPTLASAQTQHDRIDARGQVKTDKFINRATIIITGATPDVSGGNVFTINNLSPVTVTNLLGGVDTHTVTIECGEANSTFQNNTHLVNAGGTDFVCGANKTISYIYFAAQAQWVQSGTGSAGGGGGGSPGAPANCLQKNNGSGGFGCANESSNGTAFTVNEDQTNLGPNPYFNIANYGAFSSTNTATCSINAASTALSCVSNPDFANGHGIVIPKAGAATALATPPQATVTPIGILNGATTYNYQIVAEDRSGALTSSSATGTTTTGAASLGPSATSITLTSCVMTDGTTGTIGGSIATYTSSGNHNLQVGVQVDIEGFTGGVFDACNGTVTVVTTPTATTFTVFKGQVVAETNTTGTPTAKVYACNELTFAASSVTASTQMRYWIYRNSALVGVQPGVDPHYIDCGLVVTTAPAYVPSTPPGSSQVGYLSTTIVSGGGTTSLVLANAATTTATSQVVLHDNVPALRAATQAAYTIGGGTVYIPNGGGFAFNSLFDGTTFSNVFSRSVRILFNNSFSSINQPWILRGAMSIEGDPHESTSFQYVQGPRVSGTAHPMIYVFEGSTSIYLKRIQLNSAQVLQTAFMTDEGPDGGAVTGVVFDDVAIVGGNGTSRPLIIRGGFDFQWTRGVCSMQGSGIRPSYCTTFSRSSTTVTGSSALNAGQIIGRVKFDKVFFDSSGVEIDCRGSSTGSFSNSYQFNNSLFENMSMPYLKATGCVGSQFSGIQVNNLDIADNATGCSTPVVDSALGGISSLTFSGGAPGCGSPAAFITTSGSNAFQSGGYSRNPGNVDRISHLAGSQTNTRAFYPLTSLAAPAVAVSAGGGVPIGTIPYQAVAVDIDNNETVLSAITNCVTTTGNQTCTVTAPTLPAGSIGWTPYRSGAKANIPGCSFLAAGVNFVDTFGFTCGQTAQANALGFSLAGQSVLGPSGVSTSSFRLMNSGFTTTITGDNAANRAVIYPAASGTVCLTAACAVNSVTVGGDAALSSSPRAVPPVFFPGALTTTWTGASWTLDKAITVTRVQSAAKVVPAGCSTSAIVRVTDGSTPINLTINAATNDSGAITQNYAAGATLTVSVQTAAAGCATSPGDLNLSVQSRMQ